MRLAVDTNILIGELLRVRGQRYFLDSGHEYFTSERVLSEALHELPRRIRRMTAWTTTGREELERSLAAALNIIDERIEVIPDAYLTAWEAEARQRVPRDPDDWELVAVALLTDAGLWTADADFLGCGLPTWSTSVLHVLHPA